MSNQAKKHHRELDNTTQHHTPPDSWEKNGSTKEECGIDNHQQSHCLGSELLLLVGLDGDVGCRVRRAGQDPASLQLQGYSTPNCKHKNCVRISYTTLSYRLFYDNFFLRFYSWELLVTNRAVTTCSSSRKLWSDWSREPETSLPAHEEQEPALQE